jgi:hypothetical protein
MTWIIVSLVCNGMHCWWAPMKEKSFDSFRECEARAELRQSPKQPLQI